MLPIANKFIRFRRSVLLCIQIGSISHKKILKFSEVIFFKGINSTSYIFFSFSIRIIVNSFLCTTQVGICCVYLVFVALNIKEIVDHHYSEVDVRFYLLALFIPMILLNFLKNLKFLVPASLLASILSAIG